MRIVIIPFNRGLAHITRSLMVGQALKARGHDVTCLLPEDLQHFAKAVDIDCLPTPHLQSEDNSASFESHSDANFLFKRAKDLQKQLTELSPDLALVDFHIPGLIAAQSLNIHIAYITHTTGLQTGFLAPRIVSGSVAIPKTLVDHISKRAWPKYIKAFDCALQRLDLKKKHVFDGVEYIIPEPHGYLQPKQHISQKAFCGPILWPAFEKSPLPVELDSFPKENTVYITGGGTGFDAKFIGRVAKELIARDYWVVISTGGRFELTDLPKSERILSASFLPGSAVMDRVSVVLCHGGYGTLVQAAQKGVPSLSIPVNVEQLIHAARFKELEIGEMLWPFSLKRLLASWKNDLGAFEAAVNNIPVSLIVDKIEKVHKIHVSSKMQTWFDSSNSPQKAAEYIKNLVFKK